LVNIYSTIWIKCNMEEDMKDEVIDTGGKIKYSDSMDAALDGEDIGIIHSTCESCKSYELPFGNDWMCDKLVEYTDTSGMCPAVIPPSKDFYCALWEKK